MLRMGPTSWVHKMLAVIYSLVTVALLVQAVVGGPAIGDNEGSWSHMSLDEGDQCSPVPLVQGSPHAQAGDVAQPSMGEGAEGCE